MIAKHLSIGFSREHAELLSGMVVNKLREAAESDRGTSIVGRLSKVPAVARYVSRITLAAGCAAAIYPWSWWLALATIPLLMYSSNVIHDEPEPRSIAQLTFDGIIYVCVAGWVRVVATVFVTSIGHWWAVIPGAVTGFVGYHSLLPGRWIEEHRAESQSQRAA
jgi:hypothetical protein